jgi:sugar O-acyltransferase (sialic acid O-acetyltransferase NeuD family)
VNREPLLLLAAGGHARACIDVIEQEARFAIIGLVGLADEVGTRVLGYEVLGTDAAIESFRARATQALVCVGQIKDPEPRMRLYERAQTAGFTMATVVSPRAYVSRHAALGAGTIVMHGAVVNAAANVGNNCIINSQALIEHDVVIGDHCHIATRATLNSGVVVGTGTFIGSGASVKQCVRIGSQCVIGMGEAVRSDCPDGALVVHQRVAP